MVGKYDFTVLTENMILRFWWKTHSYSLNGKHDFPIKKYYFIITVTYLINFYICIEEF